LSYQPLGLIPEGRKVAPTLVGVVADSRSCDPESDQSSVTQRDVRTRALFTNPANDPLARAEQYDEIVCLHLDVAESIARRYRNRGIPHEDLVQVACLGLVKAAHGFDPDRADNFLSYAVPTMLGEVKRFFRDHAWIVRPPRRVQELQAHITASSADLQQRTGRMPTPGEVADATGSTAQDVKEALLADNCYSPTSLDRTTTEDGGTLVELLGDVEPGYARAEAVSTLRPLCAKLSPRDRRILYLRFFHEWTQARIAEELNVTQMQVSRLLRRILDDLRSQLAADDVSA
jgi:RNA polymerase sigma-B factor